MGIITLTTDFGTRDPYLGAIKGKILSNYPQATIIDITHDISPFNVIQAAYTLKNCYNEFPKGTVHIIGVDSEANENKKLCVIKNDDQYFIGTDNGIFSILFDNKVEAIYEITVSSDSDTLTFPEKNIFTKVACHLAEGGTLEVIGNKIEKYTEAIGFEVAVDSSQITGKVIHIDNFNNAITNVSKQLFNQVGRNKNFDIFIRGKQHSLNVVETSYQNVPTGEKLAIFGDNNLLQIAIRNGFEEMGGGASQLLGLKVGDLIRIEFNNNLF